MNIRFRQLRTFLDASALAALSIGALAATVNLSAVSGSGSGGMAVIFSPWTDAETALARAVGAGGRFVSFGGAPFVAITSPDDAGFVARAYAAGAWLVLDPKFLAGCFSASRKTP